MTNRMRSVHKTVGESAGCAQSSRRECGLRIKQSIMVYPSRGVPKIVVDLAKKVYK